jgi:predicted hotdog family 3-hydroxylacyl-ACP dehydratase
MNLPMNTLLQGEEIQAYIPQRPPIVMVDKLWHSDEKETLSGLFVSGDTLFVENGHLAEPGIMENIAQTAALRAGYFYKKENLPVPLGFIGSFKNLEIYSLPKVGSDIQTKVTLLHEVLEISVFEGEVFQGDTRIASCEIKIFVMDKTKQND